MPDEPLTSSGSLPEPATPLPEPTPMVEPTVAPASLPPSLGQGPGSLALAPNVAAGLAVATFGILGVAFLILEKSNQFVRFWAMQSVFLGAAVLVLDIIVFVFLHLLWFLFFILVPLSWLLHLAILVLWVVMLIQAFSGKEWEIPILGKLAREQLAKMPRL